MLSVANLAFAPRCAALGLTLLRRRRGRGRVGAAAAPGNGAGPDHRLRRVVADRRLPEDRLRRRSTRSPARTRSRRRSRWARRPTCSPRRTRRCRPSSTRRASARQPVVFTRNTLVIVVPTANPAEHPHVYDLAKPGVKLDIAGPGVPVGSYTLQILKNMNLTAAVLEERRQPGDRRARGAREGRARRGRRRASSTRPTRRPCPAR